MAKILTKVVSNCEECPSMHFEEDDRPMGGNGWYQCKILGQRLKVSDPKQEIDPECPLPDTPDSPNPNPFARYKTEG